jgi:arylsulfatase A-like enzyme
LVESIDLYPTLCELTGLSKPGQLDGRSFAPLLKAPDREWKDAAVGRYRRGDTIHTRR